ncbi:uncharacterized protein [Montipora foliosa]|uniref:uncharacterized protein isoform X1 n=1 Tax=Montipora foliosa TaxID=591990 RepID=UPI0035F15221
MATEKKTRDEELFIDVHSSKEPDETELIPALGEGRGKPTKDVTCIALPKAALGITKEKQSIPRGSTGRGRASLMKARALTDSPPVRRPGEKVEKQISSILNKQESFPPLSASKVKPSTPKWCKETATRLNKNNTSRPVSNVSDSTDERNTSSTTPLVSIGCKEDLLASSDGSDVIVIENLPTTITEQNLVELFKPYSDVLACTIDRDYHAKSLGTAVVRSSLKAFYYHRVLLIIRHTTHVLSKNPLNLADFPANVIWCLCVLQYC